MRWRRGGRHCSTDVGARVEGEAGRLRRAASFAGTWRPRGVRAQSPVGRGVGEPASERASAEAGWAGIANWAESEAAAHKVKM